MLSDPEQRKEYDADPCHGRSGRASPPRAGAASRAASRTSSAACSAAARRQQLHLPAGLRRHLRRHVRPGQFGGSAVAGSAAAPAASAVYGGPTRGRDVIASTTIDFITATQGDQITLQTQDGRPIKVKIPAGVADGQKIKLRGKGQPSPDGGEAGDIVLTVTVRKHPVFERDGLNLRVTCPVTFVEAALGATIEVPTLGGTPSSCAWRPEPRAAACCASRVAVSRRPKGTGDLLAEVQVAVPSHLSKDARGGPRGVRRGAARRRTLATSFSPRRGARQESTMDEISPSLRDLHGRRAGGHAPADPAAVRPARVWSAPARTPGKSRRYSMRDVAQLREIARLGAEGVSLEGIRRILELEDRVRGLESPRARARSALWPTSCSTVRAAASSRPARRVTSSRCRPAPAMRRSNQIVVWRPLDK